MSKTKFKWPRWAQITLIFIVISILGTVVGSVAEVVAYPALILTLWFWPRRAGKKPYLVAMFPWLTAAEGVFALILGLGGDALQRKMLGPEQSISVGLSPPELAIGVLSTPILLWAFWTRNGSAKALHRFRVALVGVAIVTAITSIIVFDSSAAGTKEWIELFSGFLAEIALTICLWKHA